jgi:PAS domain-containing protein
MNVEALDLLATSVFLVNERGHIEYANAAAEDLFGRSRKQLGGHSAATLFDNPRSTAPPPGAMPTSGNWPRCAAPRNPWKFP